MEGCKEGLLRLRQLMSQLRDALVKEKEWQPHCYAAVGNTDEEVGSNHRDGVIRWLFNLNDQFKLNPETLVLASTIMDNFLHVVKARPKYLRCIAISCLFLASKVLEEDETTPTTQYLVEASECGCSASDVLRMEKIILDKLQWNICKVTSLDFLHILHAILLYHQPYLLSAFRHMTIGRQLTMLTQKLLLCCESCEVGMFPPSTQALALISLEMGLCTPNWLAITIMLGKLVQVDDKELIQCRETMSKALANSMRSSLGYLYLRTEMVAATIAAPARGYGKPAKRKVEQIEEEDDIYDGIKRLYGEDGVSYETKMSSATSCGAQASHQDEAAHHNRLAAAHIPTVQPV